MIHVQHQNFLHSDWKLTLSPNFNDKKFLALLYSIIHVVITFYSINWPIHAFYMEMKMPFRIFKHVIPSKKLCIPQVTYILFEERGKSEGYTVPLLLVFGWPHLCQFWQEWRVVLVVYPEMHPSGIPCRLQLCGQQSLQGIILGRTLCTVGCGFTINYGLFKAFTYLRNVNLPQTEKLSGMVAHNCNPSPQEAKAGGTHI